MSETRSSLELAALATAAVPGLVVAGLRPPQLDDEVISTTGIIDTDGNHWTVVAPHDQVGGLDMEMQSAVLSCLTRARAQGQLAFDVPQPAGFIRTKQGKRAMVYPQITGVFCASEDFQNRSIFAVSLARALASLHNLNPRTLKALDLPAYSAIDCRKRHISMLEEARRHSVIPAALWDRWTNALSDQALWRFTTTPVHGDLQYTSVLVMEGCVQAISGFSSAHVGDPAEDVAWIRTQASNRFVQRFYQAYAHERTQTDLHVMTRAQLISELALVRWLVHGIHAEDSTIIEDANTMIAELAEDLGDQQLVPARHGLQPPELSEHPVPDDNTVASPALSEVTNRVDAPHEAHYANGVAEEECATGALPSCDMPTEFIPVRHHLASLS